MRRLFVVMATLAMAALWWSAPQIVLAQTSTPTSTPTPAAAPTQATKGLTIFTDYPQLVVGIGETTTLDLTIQDDQVDVAQLSMKDQPKDWTVTFTGNGKVIEGAYVAPAKATVVQVNIEPPTNVAPGKYSFTVQVSGQTGTVSLPISLTVKNKLPPKLTMTTDLPTLNGSPSTAFQYNLTLSNDGEEDLNVTMLSDAPTSFQVNFSLTGQNVTSFPLATHATKTVSVSMQPVATIQAGSYTAKITAQGGAASATLSLTAVVTGQPSLTLTTSDGRLSDQVTLGQVTPIKVILQNTGTSTARQINLTSSAPSGWKVDFSPASVAEIAAGQQVQVTANITPNDQAIAGDYQVTLTASGADGTSKSADFRITVVTSTLWGLVGVILIAIAVGVVAAAVLRFGRR
jgi:uncharacterized membrane protein